MCDIVLKNYQESIIMRKIFTSKADDILHLSGDEHKHLSIVLRAKLNDSVVVCTGDGYDYHYTIKSFTKTETVLELQEKKINTSEPKVELTLFSAILKGDKNDYVARTCTELGVSKIYPLVTKFIQVKKDSYNNTRIKKIVNEACKQCGRGRLPFIGESVSISDLASMISDYDIVVFPYEKATQSDINTVLKKEFANIKKNKDNSQIKVAVVIGSEGGFDTEEAELLISSGAECVTLGSRILRGDTACTTVCGLVMYEIGEML